MNALEQRDAEIARLEAELATAKREAFRFAWDWTEEKTFRQVAEEQSERDLEQLRRAVEGAVEERQRARAARREALEEAAQRMDVLASARKGNLGSGADYVRAAREIRALLDQVLTSPEFRAAVREALAEREES